MADILIVYATVEGQSERIAGLIADHLTRSKHAATTLNASAPGSDAGGAMALPDFDGLILVAPVHAQAHHPAARRFLVEHAQALTRLPCALVSVSLHAASGEAEDIEEMRQYVDVLCSETRWNPRAIHHAAGALRFTEFDFFKSWMARRLVKALDMPVDPRKDVEFTDWPALYAFVDDYVAEHVSA